MTMSAGTQNAAGDIPLNSSLEDLQTDEQRQVLDTIAQVRKCGLESVLSLPQLVVCGDQSAGKSSVLEALTEIPFPRNDNLCTRFATEIHLRRSEHNSLTIKVIPDAARPADEKAKIEEFQESITDFDELPRVMDLAMVVMGIKNIGEPSKPQAFARDVLSIIVEGPTRPQLTLVDIPGLIATHTKGTTAADVGLVAEITDRYISQSRTICLAVIAATNDYSNQKILDKVREVDPDGERTLGIITKPDGLPAGSGSESSYIDLASNKDIKLHLGWHVLKNRKFEERDFTLLERNSSEATYFRTSNFKVLPESDVGIDALRLRLSRLLFDHVKKELPNLRHDLEDALISNQDELSRLGSRRASTLDCKIYLTDLSVKYSETCKSAVKGQYEEAYFHKDMDPNFDVKHPSTIRRARAVIQFMNHEFSNTLRKKGHVYQINLDDNNPASYSKPKAKGMVDPQGMAKRAAFQWVSSVMVQNRGHELLGNYNPLIIGDLFWEQSLKWEAFAKNHVEEVAQVCSRLLKDLLNDKCPKDVEARIWNFKMETALKVRKQSAMKELDFLMDDLRQYPMNYNHYYTDTINKRRVDRQKATLTDILEEGTFQGLDIPAAVGQFLDSCDPNMENFGCEEALDCLFAIYKVQLKNFVANVTTQVIERHVVRGLENIFSPLVVTEMTDAEIEAIASEPFSMQAKRKFLEERIAMLEEGQEIFRNVL